MKLSTFTCVNCVCEHVYVCMSARLCVNNRFIVFVRALPDLVSLGRAMPAICFKRLFALECERVCVCVCVGVGGGGGRGGGEREIFMRRTATCSRELFPILKYAVKNSSALVYICAALLPVTQGRTSRPAE